MAIHADGAFLTTRAAMRAMIKQGKGGSIIYMGSVHSHEASPLKSAYVTAKHGLIGLAKVVAKEGAKDKIRANVICPGFVRTPLVEKQIPEQAKALGISEADVIKNVMLKETVDGEFTTVQDVAQLAVFLGGVPDERADRPVDHREPRLAHAVIRAGTFKAAIFDMDGLLIDSERAISAAWIAGARELGFRLEMADFVRVIGTAAQQSTAMLIDIMGSEEAMRATAAKAHALLPQAGGAPVFPLKTGALPLLRGAARRRAFRARWRRRRASTRSAIGWATSTC